MNSDEQKLQLLNDFQVFLFYFILFFLLILNFSFIWMCLSRVLALGFCYIDVSVGL